MKKVFTVVAIIELVAVGVLWHAGIEGFLLIHPWLRAVLAALPAITGVVLGILQWKDSVRIAELSEANNTLLADANDLRKVRNRRQLPSVLRWEAEFSLKDR